MALNNTLAFIGLMPGINIIGLILLALKPTLPDGN